MKELTDVDIRHFKLSTGDDVISMVTKDDKYVVVLSQPMQMHSVINQNTQAYYFTDWQPMAKVNTCAISKSHIVSFVECSDNVKEKYIQMCLDNNDSSNIGQYLDSDMDDMDIELDEYLEDEPDTTITLH